MQETVPAVVKDILAVVGSVDHRSERTAVREARYYGMKKLVGVSDTVVVSIEQLVAVLCLRLRGIVGAEERLFARITVTVAEVRTVCVEYDEELFVVFFQNFIKFIYKQEVVRMQPLGIRAGYRPAVVGLFSEDVDKRTVGLLV